MEIFVVGAQCGHMYNLRYTMHLFFGLGSFLTPVFARPFLGNQGKVNIIVVI